MTPAETDRLIDRLAGSAGPVRRLAPPWKRAALWAALGLPPVVAVVVFHGLAPDAAALFGDWRLVVEQVAALATAVSAAIAAFASTVPGASRRWFWLPVLPLAVWLLTLGSGCINDWLTLGLAGLTLRPDFECFPPMLVMGAIPATAMLVMLRRGAPIAPRLTLLLGTLALAALVTFGLRFFHAGDVSLMVLVWHFGFVLVLSACASLAGPQLLGWPDMARIQPR